MNEVLARLYRLTGEKSFLETAKLFDNISFFFGDASVGFSSFLSYSGITIVLVADNAGGTSKSWASKTALEIWAGSAVPSMTCWTTVWRCSGSRSRARTIGVQAPTT